MVNKMKFEVVSDPNTWRDCLLTINPRSRDIYHSYDYCFLHEANGEGGARAVFFAGENGSKIFYPFILRAIAQGNMTVQYYDIESAYGYGGPVVENYNKADMADFESIFHNWCVSNKIVAEFIRFHPLLQNHKYFTYNINTELNRNVVFIDLTSGVEAIWLDHIKGENRTRIRKAVKSGVEIRESLNYQRFIELYKSTMTRLDADDFYYFSENYFKQIFDENFKNLVLLEAVLDGRIIAGAIFLYSECYFHYHLGGSDANYLKYAPNNLLLYKAIETGYEKGMKKFLLGGGTTNIEDDSLFRFKKTFSKNMTEFYIGKRIHNKVKYDELMSEWAAKNKKAPKLFLQYHYQGGEK